MGDPKRDVLYTDDMDVRLLDQIPAGETQDEFLGTCAIARGSFFKWREDGGCISGASLVKLSRGTGKTIDWIIYGRQPGSVPLTADAAEVILDLRVRLNQWTRTDGDHQESVVTTESDEDIPDELGEGEESDPGDQSEEIS